MNKVSWNTWWQKSIRFKVAVEGATEFEVHDKVFV